MEGDTYTRSRLLTRGALEVGSFFVGAGELRTAVSGSQIGSRISKVKGLSQLTDWSALTKRAGQLTGNAFDQLRHLKEGRSFLYEALGQIKRENRLAAAIGTVRQDFSRHPARVHLGKVAEKAEDVARVVDKVEDATKVNSTWEIYKEYDASKANKWWKVEMGYDNAPYTPKTTVKEIILTKDTNFVRVYDGKISGQYGGWLMRESDIAELTAEQIKDKFALPATPRYKTDVKIQPSGTKLRTGEVNPLEGWGRGGGTQYDLMGQRIGEFTNERLLP